MGEEGVRSDRRSEGFEVPGASREDAADDLFFAESGPARFAPAGGFDCRSAAERGATGARGAPRNRSAAAYRRRDHVVAAVGCEAGARIPTGRSFRILQRTHFVAGVNRNLWDAGVRGGAADQRDRHTHGAGRASGGGPADDPAGYSAGAGRGVGGRARRDIVVDAIGLVTFVRGEADGSVDNRRSGGFAECGGAGRGIFAGTAGVESRSVSRSASRVKQGCGLQAAGKAYELPISMPVANTRTPPRPTWSAAESGGVSM